MTRSSSTKPGFLLLLAGLATALLALIIAPFAGALFASAVFAGVAHPLQVRLRTLLGDRPDLAALLLTIAVVAVVVAPLAVVSIYAVDQIASIYERVETTLRSDGLDGVVGMVPEPLRDPARHLLDLLPVDRATSGPGSAEPAEAPSVAGVQLTGGDLEVVAGFATKLLDTLGGLLIDLGVLVLAFFFLLSQGQRLVKWIVEVLPLSSDQGKKMIGEFRDVTRGVFTATVATAFLQTAVATVGYVIAGIDYLPAMILLTLIAAMIPVAGGAMITVLLGIWLLLSGETAYGWFLVGWGLVPVGLSDNLAKPWLAQGALRLPGAVVMFAMIGGLAVFGPMGIVAGPLIVAFFLASLRLLQKEGIVRS